ncbi:MAG: Do family serine endopeptidase [Deltaproteobacteria bacterium]|jgi:Do/DeqQ family serine protease|nr:Do family serine endopeptidase [Deltaproteobacteria bacterium]
MQKISINFNRFLCLILFLFCLPVAGNGQEPDRRSAVVRAVQKIGPAVVNISSEYQVQMRRNPFSEFGMNPFFDSFFKDFFDPGLDRRQKRTSLGSGVIIDGKRGFILTNAHVVTQSDAISVALEDEREFQAQIVGVDPDSDLAVLKIGNQEDLPAIEMGNSDDLMIGETVVAIGNPFGFSHTVTTGVISALNRSVRTDDTVYHNFIQTDASINPGNSGGPLLNIHGDLIGINTAIYAKAQGIGFAIPINKAKRIVSDLIQYGEVVLSWTGLVLQDLDKSLARYLKIPEDQGVIVKEVESRSPAVAAGIHKGNIILALENIPIRSIYDYQQALKSFPVGSRIKIKILQNGRRKTCWLTTSVFPQDRAFELADKLLGVQIEGLTPDNRRKYRISAKEGVVITQVAPQSYLAGVGVDIGDVIRQIDDQTISSVDDFKKAIIKSRQKNTLVILVQRGEQGYYITVRP